MQSKKTIAQSSTFSLSYCVQLIISSKNLLDLTEKITILGYLLFLFFIFQDHVILIHLLCLSILKQNVEIAKMGFISLACIV